MAMASRLRIRLQFDCTPVHYARQCWFLLDLGRCRLVGDVAYLIATHFGLEQETGIQLYMDGFLVPTNESAGIIRDNDIIQVKTTEPTIDAETSSSSIQDGSVERPHKKARLASSPAATRRKKEKRKKEKENRRESRKTSKEAPRSAEIPTNSTNDSSVLHAASEATGGSSTSTHTLQNSQGRDTEGHRSRAQNSPPQGKAGKLHAVKTRSSSGATHTKFCSSGSDSEPEQLPTQTLHPSRDSGSSVSTQRTTPQRTTPQRTTPQRITPQRITPQKHFPSVVGGPSDVHTTRSMIYVRSAELNTGTQQEENPLQQHTNGAQAQSGETDPLGKTSGPEQAGSEETRASRTVPAIVQEPEPAITQEPESAITQEPEPAITQEPEPAITQEPEPAIVQEPATVTDYSALPDLYAAPRVGDRIAFKILELSSNYSPGISDYKEAVVLAYDPTAKTMKVIFTGSTLQRERQRAAKRASGRFALEKAAIETEECPVEVELSWDSLVEPKLMP